MDDLDPRIVRVGIEVDGRLKTYEDLDIHVSGTKYANANQDECEVKIANLDRATKDYILTETSPFNKNKTAKKLVIEAGRKSTGAAKIYVGDITAVAPSPPPDIVLTIKALTGNSAKGNVIARNQPAQMGLRDIAGQVAKDLGVSLDYQASDKQISNYAFAGGALKQVDKLGDAGAVNAYLDGNTLVVKDYNVPLTGRMRILDADSGMIGPPEITEHGVKVKYLLDNQTTLGCGLQITSKVNPSANGTYAIYKLVFEIASRDTPFYYIAEAKRL